jgi:CHASE domain
VKSYQAMIVQKAGLYSSDMLHAMQTLSSTMTMNAASANQTWPFVTDSLFDVLVHDAIHGTKGDLIHSVAFAPLVPNKQRRQWERYSRQHVADASHNESKARIHPTVYSTNETYTSDMDSTAETTTIADSFVLPLWQMTPTMHANDINLDLLSHPKVKLAMDQVLTMRQAALSPLLDFDFLIPPTESEAKTHTQQPKAMLVQPIFASLEKDIKRTPQSGSISIVGVVVAFFSWEQFLQTVAKTTPGMFVVLNSSCGQDFSYQIHSDANYVGQGDLHNSAFDYLRNQVAFEPFQEAITAFEHSATNPDIDVTTSNSSSFCKVSPETCPFSDVTLPYNVYLSLAVHV